jgi:negative regulator of sigma E activity
MSNNKNMKEKISALADGELSDFETRRILTEISSNPQYRDFWRSIQQTKLSLEESDAEFLDSDISEQLYSKLGK